MSAQYIVTQSQPGIGLAAGDVLVNRDTTESFYVKASPGVFGSGVDFSVKIHLSVIETNPEYYRKVEEKEFTRRDLYEYGFWAVNVIKQSGNFPDKTEDMPYLKGWLNARGEKGVFGS